MGHVLRCSGGSQRVKHKKACFQDMMKSTRPPVVEHNRSPTFESVDDGAGGTVFGDLMRGKHSIKKVNR